MQAQTKPAYVGPDEDVFTDEEPESLLSKVSVFVYVYRTSANVIAQGTRDEVLMEVFEKLKSMYPVGYCAEHPNIACFHNRTTKQAWELTRLALLAWSGQIVSDITD